MTPAIEAWTCPGCNAAVTTPYCPGCGERALAAHELTLRGLVHQAVLTVVNVDSRLLRSLRRLVMHPGALTVAYLRGWRKPYLAPFQLFLVANVLFFAMQSLTGDKILSTPLAGHLQSQLWSPVAQELVARHLATTQSTLEQYAPAFDAAVTLNAKSLIVLMALAFALLLPMAFRRQPFVTHVVFALHFYAFLLLVLCAALAVAYGDVLVGGAGLRSGVVDHALSIVNLGVCATYLFAATGRVYRTTGLARLLQVGGLVVGVAGIFLGYRFALLLITLAGT